QRGSRGGKGGGWSSSRKGGIDYDDSIDGPCVNDPYSNPLPDEGRRTTQASAYSFTGTSSTRGRGRGSAPKVKLEMQRLFMSTDNQDMVRKTLQSLREDDGDYGTYSDEEKVDEEDYDEEYDELDTRAENEYWLSDRTLVVQDAKRFDWSSQPHKGGLVQAVSQENIFAVKKLQRCGFSTEHCQEALLICDGDVGAALEYLLNDLFNITLSVSETTDDSELDQAIFAARDEEKMALESIYDVAFEERIPNTLWVLNLELPELSQLLSQRAVPSASKKSEKSIDRKLCPFYLKGSCKFKDNCRFSHAMPLDTSGELRKLSHPIYANLKALEEDKKSPYSIEIRFPKGNKYPNEPPLLAFSSVIEELPPHSRLHITQFLMAQAKEAARDSLPCLFSLVSALEDVEQLELLISLPPLALSKPVSMSQTCKVKVINPKSLLPDTSLKTNDQNKDSHGLESTLTRHGSNQDVKREEEAPHIFVPQKRKDVTPVRVNPIEMKRQNKILQEEFFHKKSSKHYQSMQSDRRRLPAWDMREELLTLIEHNQVVVISGMTGCGKTTQVPQFILDEALQNSNCNINIVCTQPRRISAMAVAQRVADERCEKLGRCVGYQIRLESVMVIGKSFF
ncbi:unnamed protein product, partial [Lymnaea stagnalis]